MKFEEIFEKHIQFKTLMGNDLYLTEGQFTAIACEISQCR